MSAEDLKWLFGIVTTIYAFTAGGIGTWLWRLSTRMQEGDDRLHERINKVRDNYVRRDDLEADLARLDKKLDELGRDQKDMSREIIAALQSHGKSR